MNQAKFVGAIIILKIAIPISLSILSQDPVMKDVCKDFLNKVTEDVPINQIKAVILLAR